MSTQQAAEQLIAIYKRRAGQSPKEDADSDEERNPGEELPIGKL